MIVTELSEKVNLILVALFTLLLFTSSFALVVRAPNEVIVSSKNHSFDIYIYNDSEKIKNVSLKLNLPVEYTLKNMPSVIGGKNSANVTVAVDYDERLAMQKYACSLEVETENEKIKHEFTLKFAPAEEKVKVVVVEVEKEAEEKSENNALKTATAMLTMPLNMDSYELLVDIILALIAAVLLIAFISRYVKRLHSMGV